MTPEGIQKVEPDSRRVDGVVIARGVYLAALPSNQGVRLWCLSDPLGLLSILSQHPISSV